MSQNSGLGLQWRPYQDKEINLAIYGDIFNINLSYFNGPIAGAGTEPHRKKDVDMACKGRVFQPTDPPLLNTKLNSYYSHIYDHQKRIYKKMEAIFANDDASFIWNNAWLIGNEDTPLLIEKIKKLQKSENNAISFVVISDASGNSVSLHAVTITVAKIDNTMHYLFSESANMAPCHNEIAYVKDVMTNYDKIEQYHNMYQQALYA